MVDSISDNGDVVTIPSIDHTVLEDNVYYIRFGHSPSGSPDEVTLRYIEIGIDHPLV